MRHTLHLLLLFAALFMSTPLLAQDESALRRDIKTRVQQALAGEDFERLEAMAEEYRVQKSRTPAGYRKLAFFYSAIWDATDGKTGPGNTAEERRDALDRATREWARRYPASPTAHVARGISLLGRAWEARGTGFSGEVTPEAWAAFRRATQTARDYLESNEAVASRDPAWHHAMFSVARAQGWSPEEVERLLDEALERDPEYDENYLHAAVYWWPRWYGDFDMLEAFARRSADRAGPRMYALIYESLLRREDAFVLFKDTRAEWPRLKTAYDSILERYPDPWNLNLYAKFACLARDEASARSLLQRIGKKVMIQLWDGGAVFFECRLWLEGKPSALKGDRVP